jgi:hypothetical protein
MKSLLLFATIAFLSLGLSTGCNKKKKSTTVKVTVIDTAGKVVVGALVRVYANVSESTVDDKQTTDYKGEAFFSYDDIFQLGQANVAILDVDCSYGGDTGSGVIKVESEQENAITITL